jgi:hypothetical protein
MVWDPQYPWSRKSDPLQDAFKQAQSQFKNLMPSFGNLLPSNGFRNIALAGLFIFLAWQCVFIVEAAQIVNQDKGNAQARVDRTQGEANRFLATPKEYNQAKDIISKRIYIETVEEILPNIEKIIIDGKTADRMLPYLPLDRLKPKPSTAAEGQNP